MLKSLELNGFKSFAKKTTLEFKSQITAIVGPNGSGKSNIAEAFRFALGEQSIKSMRGKRGEDLIWNGSQEVGRSNRATAKLVFDNSKKLFNLDFEELSIERIVGRDGVNEYKMNQSQVRLKDIAEKLSEAHIGATGHHIISQGEADRVLRSSSKERREILEDALGLKVYQYKKIEGERKLEQAKMNMKEVDLLRKEIAPHLRFLKKQVEKAEKAEEIRQELARKYRSFLKTESVYILNKRSLLENARTPIEKKMKELEVSMEKARDLLSTSTSKDDKSESLLKIENKLKDLHNQRDAQTRELGKIEGEINAASRLQNHSEITTEKTITISIEKIEDLSRDIESNVWKSQNMSSADDIRLLLIEIGNKIKSFIDSYRSESTQSSDPENRENSEEEKNRLLSRKSELEKNFQELELGLLELEESYKNIRSSIERDKDTSREAEREIFRISSEQSTHRNEIEKIDLELRTLSVVEEAWKQSMSEAAALLGNLVLGFQNDQLEVSEDLILQNRDSQESAKREIERLKIRLEETGGIGGAEVLKEYQETEERDKYLEKELSDIERSIDALEAVIRDLDQKLKDEFENGLKMINEKFGEFFKIMFDGGEAKLVVEKLEKKKTPDELDAISFGQISNNNSEEEETGVDISLSLPRKNIRNLDMLSGGERALTSIALIFAMSQVNPPPFIILDETDAALDEANSKRYGDMIAELSKYSQLILITHNRETMSRAGVIYGVTMGKDGVSRLLSIAFDEAVSVAK